MATFIHEGARIDHTPGADIAAGDVVVQGELVGVASLDIKAGMLGALAVEGVFDFTKATGVGTTIAAGVQIYWDDAADEATTDSATGANKLIGKVVRAATDAETTVRVRLSQ